MSPKILTLAEYLESYPVTEGRIGVTNPLKQAQTLDYALGPVHRHVVNEDLVEGDRVVKSTKTIMLNVFVRVVVPPGERVVIPLAWRSWVQRVHNGVVVGGSAPQLVFDEQTDRVDDALVGRATRRTTTSTKQRIAD